MKIGIIGAMEEEVTLLRDKIENRQTISIGGSEIYTGQLHGTEVALLKSGIGKVAAAMGATLLLERCKPDVIINTGSAGGTGIDNHIRLAALQQQSSAHGGGHFTNAGFQQSNLGTVKLAGIDFATADRDSLAVLDFVAQKGNFFFHGANNANFHRFTRDVSGLAA